MSVHHVTLFDSWPHLSALMPPARPTGRCSRPQVSASPRTHSPQVFRLPSPLSDLDAPISPLSSPRLLPSLSRLRLALACVHAYARGRRSERVRSRRERAVAIPARPIQPHPTSCPSFFRRGVQRRSGGGGPARDPGQPISARRHLHPRGPQGPTRRSRAGRLRRTGWCCWPRRPGRPNRPPRPARRARCDALPLPCQCLVRLTRTHSRAELAVLPT
jgi:hypothetical protein